MTSESAISVIMLNVKPASHMKKNVAMTEVGSASALMSVDRQSRMKRKMTSTAIRPPKMMSSRTCATLPFMNSASSCTWLMRRDGNPGATRASVAWTRSEIAAVLAPDCFLMENDTASTPFRRVVERRSSKPSTTRPTSRMRTVDPAAERRMTCAISSGEVNSPLVRREMVWPLRVICPPGRSRFSAPSASATALTGSPSASSRPGSRST